VCKLQEYGHTKTYCTLRTVCVVCGELYSSVNCPSDKADPGTKESAKVTTQQTTEVAL